MATAMPPPILPAYSLRVQLFSPTAHQLGAKPLRNFRVVISAEATVREFCQEASRIHQINYGQPLTIKKVQDDQEFDITQDEIIGRLFISSSIIRIVQASSNPHTRDSVPPTSALRFDPSTVRKRQRESSVEAIGGSSIRDVSKRPRISELDPDEPLPSREDETHDRNGIIPRSQESVSLGGEKQSQCQVVGKSSLRISETPEAVLASIQSLGPSQEHFTDSRDPAIGVQLNRLSPGTKISPGSSPQGPAERASSSLTSDPCEWQAYKSAIRSVSTTATKIGRTQPMLYSQNTNAHSLTAKRDIYDIENILSEDQNASNLRTRISKLALKGKKLSNGLPGHERVKGNDHTPNGKIQAPPATDRIIPSELPLTPRSKERDTVREHEEVEIDDKACTAAAEVFEKQKHQAGETRLSEETMVAQTERETRHKIERIEPGNLIMKEANRQRSMEKREKQQAGEVEEERIDILNAVEQQKRQIEETRLIEERRVAQVEKAIHEKTERIEAKNLRRREANRHRLVEKKEELRARKAEEGRIAKQQAETAATIEVEKFRSQKAKKPRCDGAAAEELRQEEAGANICSSSVEKSANTKYSSPIPPKSGSMAQSSPANKSRKSAMKFGSKLGSPSPAQASSVKSSGFGIADAMPSVPKRIVSFKEMNETPIRPPKTRILSTKTLSREKTSSKESTRLASVVPEVVKPTAVPKKIFSTATLPIGRKSTTPILPPNLVRSSQRSITTAAAAKNLTTEIGVTGKASPTSSMTKNKSLKELRPVAKAPAEDDDEESSSEDATESSEDESDVRSQELEASDEIDISGVPKMAFAHSVQEKDEPLANATPQQIPADDDRSQDSDEEQADNETRSQNSDARDSRSPIAFYHNPQPINSQRSQTPPLNSNSQDESDKSEEYHHPRMEDALSLKVKDYMISDEVGEDSDETKSDSEAESSCISASKNIRWKYDKNLGPSNSIPGSSPPRFQPTLPPHQNVQNNGVEYTRQEATAFHSSSSEEPELNRTQSEIDQQLTSSVAQARSGTTPVLASSNVSNSARPSIRVGASLLAMHRNSVQGSAVDCSQAKPNANARKHPIAKRVVENSESESEEDSSSDSSSSEDDQDEASVLPSKSSGPRIKPPTDADSDDSDDSEAETQRAQQRAQEELSARIMSLSSSQARTQTCNSNNTFPTHAAVRSSQNAIMPMNESIGKQKPTTALHDDKYLTGYNFQQPMY